jgi:hypothetical protein
MQAQYWRYLTQAKADAVYYGLYAESAEWWDNALSIFAAIMTSGSVAAWAIWKKYEWIWAALVMLNQLLAVTKQFLPFKKRISPLRQVSRAYEEIFLGAEGRWHDVSQGNLTDAEINALITKFKQDQFKMWGKYVDNLAVPIRPRIRKQSDRITGEYFSQTYNVSVTIEK